MTRNNRRSGVAAGAAAVVGSMVAALMALPATSVAAPGGADDGPEHVARAQDGDYRAVVRRTSYGVPHIKAGSFADLGFGTGYVQAEDNLCVIAEAIITSNGDRSEEYGATNANIQSDLFFRNVIESGAVEKLLTGTRDGVDAPSKKARALVRGFVAGYNHYLETEGVTGCDAAASLGAISDIEYWRMLHASLIRAGTRAFVGGIVGATPPATTLPRALRGAAQDADDVLASLDGTSAGIGSNAYGLGHKATVGSGGMVLGNPHFPWDGQERFYRIHQTIPGKYDVEGATLIGSPMVQIGHNGKMGWSHTVSTARRFVLRKLELAPGDPTSYVVDGRTEKMTQRSISAGGVTKTIYETRYGPVVANAQFPWDNKTAHAITDLNAANARAIDGWMAMGQATTVRKLKKRLDRYQHLPWVNVIAADSRGEALYADHSVVPRVTPEAVKECFDGTATFIYFSQGVAVLDGSTSTCDLGRDRDAAVPGIFGPKNLPVLFRKDYVTNSNNSHWLANPKAPLSGYARVIGDEGAQRSLRTRLGLRMVQQRMAGTDGLPGKEFNPRRLWKVMFNNRVYGGELVRDDLVAACRSTPSAAASNGQVVDLTAACDALAGWNKKANLGSRGAHLFREFAMAGGIKFADAFDVRRPVVTPRKLAADDPAVLRALADAVQRLDGIALDARLGDVQTESRGEAKIPIHGDRDQVGAFNVITAPRVAGVGYPNIEHGASYVMAIKLGKKGPRGRQLLSYSQSTNPGSPWYGDQTELYSTKGWDSVKFTNKQIKADPNLVRYVVSSRSTR